MAKCAAAAELRDRARGDLKGLSGLLWRETAGACRHRRPPSRVMRDLAGEGMPGFRKSPVLIGELDDARHIVSVT